MQPGNRVETKQGPGTVQWTRNGPPTYATPVAVSVRLDSQRDRPGYSGTMFSVEEVRPAPVVVGSRVTVGPRYVMADHPPYAGRGTFEPDEYTTRTFRVVKLRPGGGQFRSAPSAALAPDRPGVDEGDEVVDISLTRLTVVEGQV